MVSLIKKFLSYSLCTVFGAGYFPIAPGTFTSILAAVLVYLLYPEFLQLFLSIIVVFICGLIFTKEIEKKDGKDHRHIVIDELAGQWLTFLFIPNFTFITILTGFILFRIFDILKPFGINNLQSKKGGWGVMLDDILAGIYANVVLQILIFMGFLL